MRWTHVTHTGLVRPNNEDAFLIDPALGLFAVADGMGGHRAGEVASQRAMEGLRRYFNECDYGDPGEKLVAAFEAGNRAILAAAEATPAWQGMGTTLTACLVRDQDLWVGHIGDSRAYLLRGGEIEQLTEDHTWVLELVKEGKITDEEARSHPRRNMLVRALGTSAKAVVDLLHTVLGFGDKVLLCTDGLSNLVTPAEMVSILTAGDIEAGVRKLLDRALELGGPDNITIVALEAE